MESFDPELKTYFYKIKEEIKLEHIEYIKTHPELKEILNDFITSLLLEKPENIYVYARKYFSFFNVNKKPPHCLPFVISGPSGVGKVKHFFKYEPHLVHYIFVLINYINSLNINT